MPTTTITLSRSTTPTTPITWPQVPAVQDDNTINQTSALALLPTEILQEIGSLLGDDLTNVSNARAVCRHLANALKPAHYRVIGNKRIYATENSFWDYHAMLNTFPMMQRWLQKITLVGGAFKQPTHGREWRWETLAGSQGFIISDQDQQVLKTVDRIHIEEKMDNHDFIFTGNYSRALVALFWRLPNLRTIELCSLREGEEIPFWAGPRLLRQLSFWDEGLAAKVQPIYYGSWHYDLKHEAITRWHDYFGFEITFSNRGTQMEPLDDVARAILWGGRTATVDGHPLVFTKTRNMGITLPEEIKESDYDEHNCDELIADPEIDVHLLSALERMERDGVVPGAQALTG